MATPSDSPISCSRNRTSSIIALVLTLILCACARDITTTVVPAFAPTILTTLPPTIGANRATAIGDFNADGVDELIVIAPQVMQIYDATDALRFSEQSSDIDS
jgi:hypothetical protein